MAKHKQENEDVLSTLVEAMIDKQHLITRQMIDGFQARAERAEPLVKAAYVILAQVESHYMHLMPPHLQVLIDNWLMDEEMK